MRASKKCILVLLGVLSVHSMVLAKDIVTKDGLIIRDAQWGPEECKKVDSCLVLPHQTKMKDIADTPIGVRFFIDSAGRMSSFSSEPYYSKSSIPESTFRKVQAAMIDALKRSKVRAPKLPGSPFYVLYLISNGKGEMGVTFPPNKK